MLNNDIYMTLMSEENSSKLPVLSIVIPFFNEQKIIPEFHRRLTNTLDALPESCEIIYIDDGSSDDSLMIAKCLKQSSSHIRYITLSRSFGKEAAITAGLKHCKGKATIIMNVNLQEPPELIPAMLSKWKEGYDVINMQHNESNNKRGVKHFFANCVYKIKHSIVDLHIPENVGDFRLLSAKVVRYINTLPERDRYVREIFSWPGFKQTGIQFEQEPYFDDKAQSRRSKPIQFLIDSVRSLTINPLHLATITGSLAILSAFIYGMTILTKMIILNDVASDYSLLITTFLAVGGIQMLAIGLLSEYIGHIFIETKQRPLYLIKSITEQPALTKSTLTTMKEAI